MYPPLPCMLIPPRQNIKTKTSARRVKEVQAHRSRTPAPGQNVLGTPWVSPKSAESARNQAGDETQRTPMPGGLSSPGWAGLVLVKGAVLAAAEDAVPVGDVLVYEIEVSPGFGIKFG